STALGQGNAPGTTPTGTVNTPPSERPLAARQGELAQVLGEALTDLVHDAALGGLVGDLQHHPGQEHRPARVGSRPVPHPPDELVPVEALAGAKAAVHLGAAQVLADLVWQLGGELVGEALRHPLAEGLQGRPDGPLGVRPVAQASPRLYLADKVVMSHDFPLCPSKRLPGPRDPTEPPAQEIGKARGLPRTPYARRPAGTYSVLVPSARHRE